MTELKSYRSEPPLPVPLAFEKVTKQDLPKKLGPAPLRIRHQPDINTPHGKLTSQHRRTG